MENLKPRALMILGPTASGKTAVSLKLAQSHPIEIISVDSALVYRGMDIGTAKPTKEEMGDVPHHLIDIVDIEEPYSAADFREDALRLIDEITARGHFPVIVGGTMLYAKALREGIDELPTTDPAVRESVLEEAQALGWPAMHAKLAEVDPEAAQRLNPNDSQRICRALEVFRMTGKTLSSFHKGQKEPDPTIATVALLPNDRKRLHEAIENRFDVMLENNFLEEVRRLMARPGFDADLPSMRAVGYRQAIDHLQGKTTFEEFRLAGIAATRQLAKRQITWLRSMPQITTFDPYVTAPEAIVKELLKIIR